MSDHSTFVLQKLLCEHPLYEAMREGERKIPVLIVGFGAYAPKFADLCLELGQMKGHTISITVLSRQPAEDCRSYLMQRPALPHFVNVNHSMDAAAGRRLAARREIREGDFPTGSANWCGSTNSEMDDGPSGLSSNLSMTGDTERAYGQLDFRPMSAPPAPVPCQNNDSGLPGADSPEGDAAGTPAAQEPQSEQEAMTLFHAIAGYYTFRYIFVDLGEDWINALIAELFAQCRSERGSALTCPVCYVRRNRSEDTGGENSRLYPVYVGEDAAPADIDPQLKQMAFNTHLCWESSLNLDLDRERREFLKDDYNYASSLSYVLSISYKLYSVGIVRRRDLRFLQRAGENLSVAEDDREAAALFSRKVLEKRHVSRKADALFRSLVALEHRRWVLSLVTRGWQAPADEQGEPDLDGYVRECLKAGRARLNDRKIHHCLVFSTEEMPLLERGYAAGDRSRWDAGEIDPGLDELDRVSVELHRRMKEAAEKVISSDPMNGQDMRAIRAMVQEKETNALRLYELCVKNILDGSESYTRQYDHYRTQLLDSFPETTQQEREIRQDIRRHVERITLALFPVREANLYRDYKSLDDVLVERIPFILTWQQPVLAMAFADGRLTGGRNEDVFANVASATVLSPSKIHYCYCWDRHSDAQQLGSKLTAVLGYLGRRRVHCSVDLTVVFVGSRLPGSGEQVRACRRDLTGVLKEVREEIKSLQNVSLGAADLHSCRIAADAIPVFLAKLRQEADLLYDGSSPLFGSAMENAAYLTALREQGTPYCEFDWRSKRFANLSGCEFLHYIKDDSSIRIDDMFALMNAENLNFKFPGYSDRIADLWRIYSGKYLGSAPDRYEKGVSTWSRLCEILQHAKAPSKGSLLAEDADIGICGSGETERLWKVLELVQEAGYISGLERRKVPAGEPVKVRLVYASEESRKLLTTFGELLEEYAYYQVMQTGYFDDVACGYFFSWEESVVTNELDLVMTKDFRSMIVECKAVKKQKMEQYHKLHSISGQFGIGTVMVMMGNTYLLSDQSAQASNARQRVRGSQLHIHTVWKEEEIENIGWTLADLMKEALGGPAAEET